jgi:hypothetical protein
MQLPRGAATPTTPQIIWQNLSPSDKSETKIRQHKESVRQRRGEIKTHAGGETDDDLNPIPQLF